MGAFAILKSVDFMAFAVNVKTIAIRKSGSQHGDLKPEAAGASGLCQMPPTAFFCARK